jgi:ribosomal protein S6
VFESYCVDYDHYFIDFYQLTDLMKKVATEVVEGGGIVRAVHNHGIRDLPHRFQAKFADRQGVRYYQKGRFISVYYESNPITMRQVEQVLNMNEEVLRNTHLKTRSIVDFVNISRHDRNPYIQKVVRQMSDSINTNSHQMEQYDNNIESNSTSPSSSMTEGK